MAGALVYLDSSAILKLVVAKAGVRSTMKGNLQRGRRNGRSGPAGV